MRTSLRYTSESVYSYLPFMVLPCLPLEKLDSFPCWSGRDLGSPPCGFLEVSCPSVPGIIAVPCWWFIPAIGEFVTQTLLGGPNNLMIGRVLLGRVLGTAIGRSPPPWPSRFW